MALLLLGLTVMHADAQRSKKKTTKKEKTKTTKQVSQKEETKKSQNLLPDDKDKTVTITSTFTPTLRESSKINFTGNSNLPSDTNPNLNYSVPPQNLFFPYVAGSLRPLAYNPEYENPWKKDGFVKLGFGNYSSPYAEAGLSFGDGVNSSVGVHVKHQSFKGNLAEQKSAQTGADVNGIFNIGENNELSGKLYFANTRVRAYGVRDAADGVEPFAGVNKDSLGLHYGTYGVKLQLRNKQQNVAGVDYSPSVAINYFSDNWKAHESNFVLDVPVSKNIDENFSFGLGFTGDITSYKSLDTSINNNIFYVKPYVAYASDNFKIRAGLNPSWDNSNFRWLPDVSLEAKIPDHRFVVLAGYKSYYEKNTFKTLVDFNPWIVQPYRLENTRSNEIYGGLKGSAGSHLTYQATLSYITFYGHPLFLNDSVLGNRFYTAYEPKMKDLRIHGELGYKVAETFSVLAGASINQYSNLNENEKAWGLLPFELNASMRWHVIPSVLIKSDVNFWTGGWSQDANYNPIKMKSVADWDAGVEWNIYKNWNVWLQCNNILNNKYQRWNQYRSLGTQVVGGIIYNFDLSK
ncbi:MAG: hypothetical protein QM610_13370 [Chitinophagaceae bacterium]